MNSLFPTYFIKAIGLFLLVVAFAACKHEPVLPVNPPDPNPVDSTATDTTITSTDKPCDPDSVYFETDVLPILISNCAITTCHDASSRQEGIDLTSYQAVLNSGVIKVNDPADSDLYEAITDTDPDKVMPPPPRTKLNADQAALILKWIQQGAQNLSCDAGGCDTTNITYSATVAPLLQAQCTGCHSGTSPSGGISLSTHAGVAAMANNGKLYGAIAHQPGFSAMPQGGNQLPDCQIKQIQLWIDAGAPNN